MKLWTVWLDYFATGEGRTYIARIAYAETQEEARQGFAELYSTYFADGALVSEGVVRNGVTDLLFSPRLLDHVQAMAGEARLTLEGCYHFNRS